MARSIGPAPERPEPAPSPSAPALPAPVRRYLAHPGLTTLWAEVRRRLERNRLIATGLVRVALDDVAADRLGGLLGRPVPAGTVTVRLAELDEALRRSAASAGLLTVVGALTGGPLIDRVARREAGRMDWAAVWTALDGRLAEAGLADASWVPAWIDGLRRAGTLTRIGPSAALSALQDATAVLRLLRPDPGGAAEREPAGGTSFRATGPAERPAGVDSVGAPVAEPQWELAELAGRCIGDAHGLDEGRPAGLLVLRAAAASLGLTLPGTSTERRALWSLLGVTTDQVSGTVLAWALRPSGGSRWAAMMRERADLGLVTHLTVQELRSGGAEEGLGSAGAVLHACENPQVLQAAARAASPAPLLCFAGNPAVAGWSLLERLVAAGTEIRYHGDFDWPGVAIAERVIGRGARPWRLTAADYRDAVAALPPERRLDLTGRAGPTPWDPELARSMSRIGVVVHEEAVLAVLLADLSAASPDGGDGPETPTPGR